MPEALLAIPPLHISTGNSSEAETAAASSVDATDRSSTSQDSLCSAVGRDNRARRPNNFGQCKGKVRKSNGRRSQKKSLNVNCQQKNTPAALKLKSRIPRPLLLSPSSSFTSFNTESSFRSSNLTAVDRSIATKEQTITTVLQRQKTGIILAYRQRKSISQMDIKHFRRNMQMPHTPNGGNNGLVSSDTCSDSNIGFSHNDVSFIHKMYHYNDLGYGFGPQQDPRMAGMKIFASIMLNAWRKRRDQVKRLLEEVAELKKGAVKSRNQLHVLNSLFRVEQKRNDELNCQLKRSLEDINTSKSSCESLTTSIISLKADKALLEQQLESKDKESDSLNTLLSQTKSELFKSMAVQRDLQANISMGQRKVQTLENQKNDLINEMFELNIEARQTEELLQAEIRAKSEELKATQKELCTMEERVTYLNGCRQQESHESVNKQENMRKDMEKLEEEVEILRRSLDKTLGKRLKNCWHNSLAYPGVTLEILHWFVYYVLPATPPPKSKAFPFGLTLDKALSIVKR